MSEVSMCISDTHDGKMDFEEVRGTGGVDEENLADGVFGVRRVVWLQRTC